MAIWGNEANSSMLLRVADVAERKEGQTGDEAKEILGVLKKTECFIRTFTWILNRK